MNGNMYGDYSEEELEELEEELLEEDFKEREEKMSVDGRSVFDIHRLKKEKGNPENRED